MANEKIETDSHEGGQFLTFRLEEEVFGVPIEIVQEVLDYVPVTRVPGAVDFLKGVVNLRGAVVPVADIRIKFDMPATVLTENSCIIVVEITVSSEEGKIIVGLLADQVLEVAQLSSDDIQTHPEMGTGISSHFLRGLGKLDEAFLMMLDVDSVINEDDGESTSHPH